jgi:hypothetical protein
MSFFSYFRSPFPSTQGFSAYRMPGLAAHGPLILAFFFAGFFLCRPHALLRPLLFVWLLGGLYLGRDFAIICHYSPPLTLVAWGAFALVLFRPAEIARFGRSHFLTAALLSVTVATALFLVAFSLTREKREG